MAGNLGSVRRGACRWVVLERGWGRAAHAGGASWRGRDTVAEIHSRCRVTLCMHSVLFTATHIWTTGQSRLRSRTQAQIPTKYERQIPMKYEIVRRRD